MNNRVSIRLIKENEIGIVSNLWTKLAYNQMSRDSYYDKNPEFLLNLNMENYFKNCFLNNDCFIFVADYEGRLIGFAEMWLYKKDFFFNHDDYAYVLHGFVDKTVKIGVNPLFVPFKLFQACEDKAIELGYKYIAGDVFDFNTQMKTLLKLYRVQPYRTRYIKRLVNYE